MAIVKKQWTKEEIKELLATNDGFLTRSLVKIYEFQTASEQDSELTVEQNGVGFNGVDAEILTSFAKQVIKGRMLSEKQIAIARKKMIKYAGQIMGVANNCSQGEGEVA